MRRGLGNITDRETQRAGREPGPLRIPSLESLASSLYAHPLVLPQLLHL